MRTDEERSGERRLERSGGNVIIMPSCITNNLPLVASLLAPSLTADEMTSYLFKDNRNEDDEANDGMPDNANEEVKLVFSLKEVKAIIDFGKGPSGGQGNNWGGQYSQKNPGAWAANPEDDYLVRGENPVSVFYEWGGKPVTFRVEGKEDEEGGGSEWAAELISATLVDQLNETVNGVD